MTVTKLAAFNMGQACQITRGLVIKNPVKPDLSPDYVAVQGWPLVTALYNGIEQALKMLLLVPSNARFTLETLAKRPSGHDLEELHAQLEADDRDHIQHRNAISVPIRDADTALGAPPGTSGRARSARSARSVYRGSNQFRVRISRGPPL